MCRYSELLWSAFSDWISTDTPYLSVFSPMQGNVDQNNSEYGRILRNVFLAYVSKSVTFLLEFFFRK